MNNRVICNTGSTFVLFFHLVEIEPVKLEILFDVLEEKLDRFSSSTNMKIVNCERHSENFKE